MTTANLAIKDNETVIQYTSIGESIFTFPFPFLANDEIRVSVDQVDQVLGVDFNLSGIGAAAGGTVTFTSATTIGELITIWQDMPFKRLTGFSTGAAVLAGEALNTEFARQVRHDQQVRREIGLALRLAVDDPQSGQDMLIPTQTTRAGKALAFDASGKPTVLTLVSSEDASLRADLASQAASLGFNLVAITKTGKETTAGATIVNAHRPVGHIGRYGTNTTPGTTDMAVAIQAAIDVAELGGVAVTADPEVYATSVKIDISGSVVLDLPGVTIFQLAGSDLTTLVDIQTGGSADLFIRLRVDGNKANNTAINGVVINGVQTGYSNIMVSAVQCDNGVVVEGNTETNVFFFDVSNCGIGVLERDAGGLDPDENTIFIVGHTNDTHYKKSCAAGRKITSMIHFSCENATNEAFNITTADSVSTTILNGELRGCASHGGIIDDPSGHVFCNNLYLAGTDVAATLGLRVDRVGDISGEVKIENFAGGAWMKSVSGGSLLIKTSALDGPDAAVRLGDVGGGTSAQRFILLPGTNLIGGTSTTALHFDNAFHCVAYLQFVAGLTNDVLIDGSSQNNEIYANGRSITISKYVDQTTANRDNKFVFSGEAMFTWANSDTTPSVLGADSWQTGTAGVTVIRFKFGYRGQRISVLSKAAIVFDTSTDTRLKGSTVDITTAAGDITTWLCEQSGDTGSVWHLTGFVDASVDNSAGA